MIKRIILRAFLILLLMQTLRGQQRSYDTSTPLMEPKIFAKGTISTGDYESFPAFSPTGDTIYFAKCSSDLSTMTICLSSFRNGKWTEPAVASFSGKYVDTGPFVAKDGKTVYFISNRPVQKGDAIKTDTDIWSVTSDGKKWSEPFHLSAPINSAADEYYPTLTDNGTMYFASRRPGGKGGSDVYRCRLQNDNYSLVENLGDSINTSDNEYEPFIAPDESYLIFMATRPNGLKNSDFYISYNKNGTWSRAEKLQSPISTDATEWSPKVTRDGKYFFFASTRTQQGTLGTREESMSELTKRLRGAGNGLGDIYQVDFSALSLSTRKITQMNPIGDDEKDRKALSALNAQFIRNFINNDTAAHNKIIHRDFVCIEGSGKVTQREEYMNDWAHGYDPNVFASFTYGDEEIRIFGNVALVRSKTYYTKKDNGTIVPGNSVYTDTYLKENGQWLCVQAQITRVPPPKK